MIQIKGLSHTYTNRDEEAIKNINLHIKKGEHVVIIGSSGSGKSTLLKCINRLIEPTNGEIIIAGEDILNCPHKKAEKIRGEVGMIFQNFNLIERETVIVNVLNGCLRHNPQFDSIIGRFSNQSMDIAENNIQRVGLKGLEHERVNSLSGGQKQRVAIARALSQKPEVILADEPVSNLDPKLMKEIMDLLIKICEETGITLVASLHFLDMAKKYSSRIIGMRAGCIVFDGLPEDLTEKDMVDIYGKTKDWYMYGKTGF